MKITCTIMMPKLSVGCLVFLVVQLYWALENNSIERHAEVNYHCRSGTVCDNYLDNNDAQVLCRMLGFTVGTALQDLENNIYKGLIWSTTTVDVMITWDNNDVQVICRMLGFTCGTVLPNLGEQ